MGHNFQPVSIKGIGCHLRRSRYAIFSLWNMLCGRLQQQKKPPKTAVLSGLCFWDLPVFLMKDILNLSNPPITCLTTQSEISVVVSYKTKSYAIGSSVTKSVSKPIAHFRKMPLYQRSGFDPTHQFSSWDKSERLEWVLQSWNQRGGTQIQPHSGK